MDQNEYLTIKKFAELAGVSTQSVYKRLATSLQPYVKEVANQRMLNILALQDVYGIEVVNGCKPKRQEVVNGCKPKNEEKEQYEEQIRQLMDKVHELEIEVIQKDALVKEKDFRITDLKAQHEVHVSDLKAQYEAHLSDLQRQMEQLHEDLRIEKQSNMVLLAQKHDAEVAVVADRGEEHEVVQKKSWWRKWFM